MNGCHNQFIFIVASMPHIGDFDLNSLSCPVSQCSNAQALSELVAAGLQAAQDLYPGKF